MVTRTQIVLESELHQKARLRAQGLGISFAEYVRRLVAADLSPASPPVSITAIFDLGDSGGSDIANEKDRLLDEAMESERRRWQAEG